MRVFFVRAYHAHATVVLNDQKAIWEEEEEEANRY
jgi:hypothetical protein